MGGGVGGRWVEGKKRRKPANKSIETYVEFHRNKNLIIFMNISRCLSFRLNSKLYFFTFFFQKPLWVLISKLNSVVIQNILKPYSGIVRCTFCTFE